MKRSVLILLLLTVVCLALAGCGQPAVPTLTISQIPWPDDEVTTYTIEDQDGSTIATGELTIQKGNNTYLLIQHFEISAQEAVQHTTVNVSAADLKPISGNQTIQTPEGVLGVVTIYSEGQVSVTATIDGDEQSATFEIPDNAYDNDEVLFLLRAIPYEVGYIASFTNVASLYGLTSKVTVKVVGEEDVTTPAGSFNCYNLEFSIEGGAQKQYVWYGVDQPHYLVKYDNGATIFLLTDHP